MDREFITWVLDRLNADSAAYVERIQSLWSGYGEIARWTITNGDVSSVIVKHIDAPDEQAHPRGWNTNTSHERKMKSYVIESNWYTHYQPKAKTPKCYGTTKIGSSQYILLEDLDAEYPLRKDHLTLVEVTNCVHWLADFHAQYMDHSANDLWSTATYWHLETRPDELKAMPDSPLKRAASAIDKKLSNAKYQTVLHGDAKVANFCFSGNGHIAAVDFQYVGKGCGMKDFIYLLGSCLADDEISLWQDDLLDRYFDRMTAANPELNHAEIQREWRELLPFAWADFNRFLEGWMPGHHKLKAHSRQMTEQALSLLTF